MAGCSSASSSALSGQSGPLMHEFIDTAAEADIAVIGKPLDDDLVQKLLPNFYDQLSYVFHWAALFMFHDIEGPGVITCRLLELDLEAVERTKIIKCKATRIEQNCVQDLFEKHGYKILEKSPAPRNISPKAVFEVATNLGMNGQVYDAMYLNCQHWVKQLCAECGVSISACDVAEKGGYGQLARIFGAQAMLKIGGNPEWAIAQKVRKLD